MLFFNSELFATKSLIAFTLTFLGTFVGLVVSLTELAVFYSLFLTIEFIPSSVKDILVNIFNESGISFLLSIHS